MRPTPLPQRFTPAPLALAAAITIALAAGLAPPAHAQGGAGAAAATPMAIDIPAQPLAQALNELARQANLQMTFSPALVAGKRAPAVRGNLTATQALDRMLAGSGLLATLDGASAVIRQPSPAPTAASPVLPGVVVPARRPDVEGLIVRQSTGTALFGAADLQDIPFSVNIVGETEITNRQATSLSEILATDPSIGFEYQDAGGMPFDRLSIRGFTQNNQVINGQLTGLDTVSIQSELIDRVEVLRGPAAFRFGFLAPGGAINIVTKRPRTQARTTATLRAATESQLGAHLDHSSHFDQDRRLGYRINAVFSDGETPIDTTGRQRGLIALATDLKLSDSLTLRADISYSNIQSRGGNSMFPNIQIASDGRALRPIDPRRTIQPAWGTLDATSLLGGLELEYRIAPGWQVTSMFRYLDAFDQGYGGVTFYDPFQPNGDHRLANYGYRNEYQSLSNLTFIQGTFRTNSVTHRVTSGFSYTDSSVEGFFAQNNNAANIASNLYNPATLPFIARGPWVPGFESSEEQIGAFILNEMTIGNWRPLVGLRYSKLRSAATWNAGPISTSKASPLFALSYDLSDTVTWYASYSTGLESGGLAPATATNANAQMPPLQSRSVEVGTKARLLGDRLALDAALFRVARTSAFTDASNTFVQRGEQVHSGVEAMAKGRIWQPLEISAGFTFIDARLQGDPASAGSRPVNVPRLTAIIYGEYQLPGFQGLHLTGKVTHRGARDYNIPNVNRAPAYNVVDLGVRHETRIAGRNSTFRLNVSNLFNESYYKMIDTFGGTLGAPRAIRASVEVPF